MFRNLINVLFRNAWNNKSYSFLNIFGLGIGIACAGLIFLWVEDEVHYDSFFPKRDRICQVMTNQTFDGVTRTFLSTPGPLAPAIRQEVPGIVNACRANGSKPLFSFGDKSIYEFGMYADSSFLSIFEMQPADGYANVPLAEACLRDLQSVVISEKLARQFFGDARDVVGKNLRVDNKDEFRVTGVFKDLPVNSSLQFDWVAPFAVYARSRDWLKYWGANAPKTYIELRSSEDLPAVRKRLSPFIQSKDKTVSNEAIALPMKDWRLRNDFVGGKQAGGRITFVRLFGIIAWIILLIACINFMNLATARSEKRAREVGVRKVLGAGRGKLVMQFMGEAMVLSILSVLAGLVLISATLPFFNVLVEKSLVLGLGNPIHLAGLAVITLFCGLVAGSYPSLYLSSFNPVAVFKGLTLKHGGAAMIRKGLVVFQFTVSIVLIISTALVYQQIQHIMHRDLGYNKDRLLDMKITGTMQKDFPMIRQDLLNTGVVVNAALCSTESLVTSDNSSNYSWAGKDPNSVILVSRRPVTPEYISTMGMHLVEGRDFYANNQLDSTNILITETLAKMMGKGSAVGKLVRQGDQTFTVVGVVKDYIYGDLYGKPRPGDIFSRPDFTSYLYVRYTDKVRPDEALAAIAAVMKKDNPAYPFAYNFVNDEFDNLFKSEMLIGRLSRVFAFLAIVISCLGLFGLAAYTAERRRKEIGIRKLLGASMAGLAGLLSRDFLKLVALSCVIAFPMAWWAMHDWLQHYAYHIEIGWWIFLIAGALAVLIALITVSFQAIRAAIANPIQALKRD